CPVKGFGIKGGAIASSVSHDAHNIVVIGDNDQDIIAAVAELKRMQGGYVIASKGKIVASLQLKIVGLYDVSQQKFLDK
ncbi:MAG: adenine deaminase C-terminal domain-containing protein, partial [Breznakia sp.]